jgi:hypothetical protein
MRGIDGSLPGVLGFRDSKRFWKSYMYQDMVREEN